MITSGIVLLSGIFILNRDFSFPDAFLLMIASFSLFSGVEAMGVFSIFSKMTQQSIDRINHIKDIPKMEETSGSDILHNYDITFEHVTFAYDEIPVLKDISFHVPEGKTIALVGLSGSGKTTITNLVARFRAVIWGRAQS